MPARQDQTLQIFLIVFIFLFLVSAAAAYFGWRGYSEADQRAAQLQTNLTDKDAQNRTLLTTVEDHQERIGFGRSDSPESVKSAFEADMKAYGAGVADEGSRSYRKVLEAVYKDAVDSAAREATLKDQMAVLTKDMQSLDERTAAQIAKVETARKQVETDRAAEKSAFDQARVRMKKTEDTLMAKVESQKNEFEAKVAKADEEKQALVKEVEKLAQAVRNLTEQRKDEPGSFEVADGRISWVNQNGTVWINLGSADSLRRQVTFSVYDADQHDAAKATKKGSIEVTRLLGPHMAEAKVTEDDARNPILTGDNVYSQVWHRGKQLHFALTGLVDLDGDARSDMQLARELIELNGGIVDAYLKDDGTTEGEITANTRYLVLGDIPDSPTLVKLSEGWHQMSKTASELGVESITIPEFLSQMGYKPQDRTLSLGEGASARDFPARAVGDDSPVNTPRFRARTPYRAPALPPQ